MGWSLIKRLPLHLRALFNLAGEDVPRRLDLDGVYATVDVAQSACARARHHIIEHAYAGTGDAVGRAILVGPDGLVNGNPAPSSYIPPDGHFVIVRNITLNASALAGTRQLLFTVSTVTPSRSLRLRAIELALNADATWVLAHGAPAALAFPGVAANDILATALQTVSPFCIVPPNGPDAKNGARFEVSIGGPMAVGESVTFNYDVIEVPIGARPF